MQEPDCKVCRPCKNALMGLERSNAESGIMRAQDNSLTLSDIAKGYEHEAENVMEKSPAAPAVRNEVKKFMTDITSSEGQEQLEHINKLVRAPDAYKAFFKDIWTDEQERAPFALALVRREKALQ